MNDDDMSEPLTQSVGSLESDNVSQQSIGSSGSRKHSLLERIKAQHQKQKDSGSEKIAELQPQHVAQQQHQQQEQQPAVQIPQYDRVPEGISSLTNGPSAGAGGNIFTDAWSSLNASIESGMAMQIQQDGNNASGLDDALLPPSSGQNYQHYDGSQEYSMSQYFMTFVMDIYGLFTQLPLPIRWILVILLLYVAFKLL